MYSYEIEEKLKSESYNIDPNTYIYICKTSPQIVRTKYNPFEENFDIWTNDNYHWTFKVNLRGEE